jgi:hypothetical protein
MGSGRISCRVYTLRNAENAPASIALTPLGPGQVLRPAADFEGTNVSSLSERRRHRVSYPWHEGQPSRWMDFILPVSFSAIGLLVTAFAVTNGIPIGEGVLWGG